ncbi:MAG: hypothetical protein H0W33_07660 [Gammaproteobacteria bacterium]|nr:hypothetical protein [Gammaproteobacteria bacterium]
MTGVVVALALEARCLEARGIVKPDALDAGAETRIHVAGIGAARARAAAQALLDSGARALVSWGSAGALDPRLVRGDLLLPESILDGGTAFTTDAAWLRILLARLGDLRPCTGALLQSGQLLDTAEAKARARKQTGASAADMESGAVADVAAAAGLPFVAIRAVIDRASDNLPLALDAEGRWRTAAIMRGILHKPGNIAALISLGIGSGAVYRSLGRVAGRLGPGLAAPV